MLAVAHRAGNEPAQLRPALAAGVDLVEADVRHFRGRPEVRHLKTLGPRLLWDHPWRLVRRRAGVPPALADVLIALDGDHRLMLDLKGVRRGLAPDVARALREWAPGLPVAVCTRHWWMLAAFGADPHVRLVPSAGSGRQLRLLRRLQDARPDAWPGGRRPYAVSVRRTLLTPDTVRDLRRSGGKVLTWPVDTPDELADARRLGVDGVTGKDLSLLRRVLTERAAPPRR